MKRFTIITVCLNTEDMIGDTIQSVLEQTDSNFEYIIKDGMSKDKTLEIAQSYAAAFAARGIPYRIISQPDSGIYDAMNQAAHLAQGNWLIFMNAGDLFADAYVLEMVSQSGKLDTADIVYGDRIDSIYGGYWPIKARALESMRVNLPFCHQSAFIKKELCDQSPYSLRYRLSGDYIFFSHWYREGARFAYLPIAICIFDRHGVSSDGRLATQDLLQVHEDMPVRDEQTIEILRARIAHMDQKPPIYRRLYQRLIPTSVRTMRRERMRRAQGWMTVDEFTKKKEQNGGRVNLPR